MAPRSIVNRWGPSAAPPIDPAAPIENNEPTDPIDRTEPAEPIDRIDPAEPIDRIDPAEPIDAAKPTLQSERIDQARPDRSPPSIGTTCRCVGSRACCDRSEWVGQSASVIGSPNMAATTAPPLRKALKRRAPGLAAEREMWDAGCRAVVGIDEVGRGSWAGPLMIGAAVLPSDRRVYKVRDSKMLTEREREALFDRITEWCVAWAVGWATQSECDEMGMSDAQRLAARRAIEGLGVQPDGVLLDGNWDFVGRAEHPTDRQGRRDLPVDRGGVDRGQGHAGSSDARRSRELSRLRLRLEQGLSVPPTQDGAGRHGPDRDPPAVVGVHGQHAVDGHPATCGRPDPQLALST